MSANLLRHLPFFEFLAQTSPKIRKTILENCDKKLILALCEICLNFSIGNIKIEPKNYSCLKKFKKTIYKLASVDSKKKRNRLKFERKLLMQNGSGLFLPLLLSPVLSGITQYLLQK